MKKAILLIIVASFSYLSFSSFIAGASYTYRFSDASVLGCGGVDGSISCHGSSPSTNTIPILILVNKATTDTVKDGKYTPGETYTLIVGGVHPTATGYGFQLKAHQGGATQSGTFAVNIPSVTTQIRAVPKSGSFIDVFEHDGVISTTGGFSATVEWTAPAEGFGATTFSLAVNAVNKNSASTGDDWELATLYLEEGPVSVNTINNNTNVILYPNPATSSLQLKGVQNNTYYYSIYNLRGSIVLNGVVNNSIDVSSLVPDVYLLKLANEHTSETMIFNKQ